MAETSSPGLGVLLVNLGTPERPDAASVRTYLRQFLSDPRVVELPRWLWWVILRCFVLTFRPRRVAALYRSIWTEQGSPMRVILDAHRQQLAQRWQGRALVKAAMCYGAPAIATQLDELLAAGVDRLLVLPLYPQYSATTTAAVLDQVGDWMRARRNIPQLRFVRSYARHPRYIAALADSVRRYWQEHGRAERLLMSFHGIPQDYYRKGDPYPDECRQTALALAAALQLEDGDWQMSFQSRFGAQVWMQPYTDKLLEAWGRSGVAHVQVICPAFSADCLETLEEIAHTNRETFLHAGGRAYGYIPALNTDPLHLDLFDELITTQTAHW